MHSEELSADQRELFEAMSELSEECCCAGWYTGTEHGVWRLIHQGGCWGLWRFPVEAGQLEKVRRAMARAQCRIVWCRRRAGTRPRRASRARQCADTTGVLYIHAKAVVADAGFTTPRMLIGSQNFSVSSRTRNRELGLIVTYPGLVSSVAKVITGDAERS